MHIMQALNFLVVVTALTLQASSYAVSSSMTLNQVKIASPNTAQSIKPLQPNVGGLRSLRGRAISDDDGTEERGIKELGKNVKAWAAEMKLVRAPKKLSALLRKTKSLQLADDVEAGLEKTKELINKKSTPLELFENNVHPDEVAKLLRINAKEKLAGNNLKKWRELHKDPEWIFWRQYADYHTIESATRNVKRDIAAAKLQNKVPAFGGEDMLKDLERMQKKVDKLPSITLK